MKILIVEDSNTFRFKMLKTLSSLGYNDIAAVGSVEEAVPLLVNRKFDLLFLDWNLPKMSGLDLLRYIRSSPAIADLNVIMVTTIHERRNILQALKIGLQGYILKPINSDVFTKKLKDIEEKLSLGNGE